MNIPRKSIVGTLLVTLGWLGAGGAGAAEKQETIAGEVHTSDYGSGSGVYFRNSDIGMADGSVMVVDNGKPLQLENSTLNIDGVSAAITLNAPLRVTSSSEFNVTNGAVASVCLQGQDHHLYINAGSSLNVDNGSTLLLTFSTDNRTVSQVIGETSLSPKAEINVSNHSHIVIRMDESWVGSVLGQLSTASSGSGKSIALMTFSTWNIDETSSITLEGPFIDSRYGSLTLRSGIGDSSSIGKGEIGLIWDGNTLKVRYVAPLTPYRALDISSASGPIGDGTYDTLTGSAGTATVLGKVVVRDAISLGEGAVVKLEGANAAVSYGGITVSNKDSANGAEIRGCGDAPHIIANALVRVEEDAPQNLTLDAALDNVLLENNNKGTMLSAAVESGSLSGVRASGGTLNLEQLTPGEALVLQSLVIKEGGCVSVSGAPQPKLLKATAAPHAQAPEITDGGEECGGILNVEQLAAATALPIQAMLAADAGNLPLLGAASPVGILIEENGNAQFGSGAVLNAGLTLNPGVNLIFNDALLMDGCLTLSPGMRLEGELLSGIDAMEPGDCLVLIQGDGAGLRYAEELNDNPASLYFNNIDAAFKIMADGSRFGLVMGIAAPAPEPAPCMLSLLGLAALASRRRRR